MEWTHLKVSRKLKFKLPGRNPSHKKLTHLISYLKKKLSLPSPILNYQVLLTIIWCSWEVRNSLINVNACHYLQPDHRLLGSAASLELGNGTTYMKEDLRHTRKG